MFDGFHAVAPSAGPGPAPRSFDARALVPVLRMRGLQASIEGLSMMLAWNAIAAARAEALGQVTGDVHDDAGRAGQALTLLAEVAGTYRSMTGGDGLALACDTITRHFGAHMAELLLRPLRASQWEFAIDALLHGPDGGDVQPPSVTPAECRRARQEIADYALADPAYAGVNEALNAYLAALEAGPAGEADDALVTVKAALWGAVEAGVSHADIQGTLDIWSHATGGPRFDIR